MKPTAYLSILLTTLVWPNVVYGARDVATAASIKPTVDRALDFLAKDALAWKAEHNCSSCHHAAMVVWAMNEAKLRNHTVDENVLKDLTQWLTEGGEGKTSVPRPKPAPNALNTQSAEGSWPMKSRPTKPGGAGADNLIPITGAASAWAVMGLVRSDILR